jgi:lipopolysaccharide transport system permease protein
VGVPGFVDPLSCQSLINNNKLVTKVYFPKEILPIAAVLAQLFDLLVVSYLLVVLLIVVLPHLSPELLWAGPLLAITVILAIGISFLTFAGSLFFRDMKYIVEVFLTFAIFFTPMFYEVSCLGKRGSGCC